MLLLTNREIPDTQILSMADKELRRPGFKTSNLIDCK